MPASGSPGIVKNWSTWKLDMEPGHSQCFQRVQEAFHGSSQMEGLGFNLYVAPTDSLCPSISEDLLVDG